MKTSLLNKLDLIAARYQELSGYLSDPNILQDQEKFRDYSKEYSNLENVVQQYENYCKTQNDLTENETLLQESDKELRSLAEEEHQNLKEQLEALEQALQVALIPEDPADNCNIYLEIRAGTGGDEASIFAGNLFRMYARYAEIQRWQLEIINAHEAEKGGYKEVIAKVSGKGVYGQLKFESGAHRVQRVPETEAQGRIHTSACTVAILPELEEIKAIEIKTEDLRIDTYRASGAGGQHVNKTDSAIRITHIPTGVVVECQEERSQHKNRAKAYSLLQAKLLAARRSEQQKKQADTRRNLVGSGDRSERIRTYNYPQGRITDHRINLTLYKLEAIMEGEMTTLIQPLQQEHQADQLAALGTDEI